VSHPLPTHEVVAVFPAEIKAGLVRLPVRMHGSMQILAGSEAVMTGVVASLIEAGIRPPEAQPAAATCARKTECRGKPAQRGYWRRMRALRAEYDFSPRIAGSLRALAQKHGIPYGSTFNAFAAIRAGHAPFPDEEPPAPRPPVSKPNGKLL
jgi:hypothetical protein